MTKSLAAEIIDKKKGSLDGDKLKYGKLGFTFLHFSRFIDMELATVK